MNISIDPHVGMPFLEGLCSDLQKKFEERYAQPEPTRFDLDSMKKFASVATAVCFAAASVFMAVQELAKF